MDVKQKYIREAGYDVAEDFVETLQQLDIRTGIKIAKFIQENIHKVEENILVSTILEGIVIDDEDKPVTFAVEIIKDYSPNIILSDIQLISMDEYLDLLNLNLKSNDRTTNTGLKKNNRRRL